MDALALLCTLYAEGPVTLARLREGGCATIDEVLAREPRDLAPLLLSTEATAQRFQREARNLHERVGADESTDLRSRTFDARALGSSRSEPAAQGAPAHPSSDDSGSRPSVLDRVLAAWRERDEREDLDDGREHAENREQGYGAAFEREEILQPAMPMRPAGTGAPRQTVDAAIIPIGAVDGLDAEASGALARAGVRDLRALAVCDPLIVARASGLSWTRLGRLRALARRVPGLADPFADPTGSAGAGPAHAEEKVSPSERPLVEREINAQLDRAPADLAPQFASRSLEGAGGPFA